MNTHRFIDVLPDKQALMKSRPWYTLAAVLLLLSAFVRQPVLFFAAGFALLLGLLPELWYRFALRSVVVSHQLSQQRVHFGERLTLSLVVENRKWLPLPWLEIEEELPAEAFFVNGKVLPTYKPERKTLVNVCSLWAFQRVTRRYQLRCLGRGKHVFGPAIIRNTDPFGWLMREQRLEARHSLIVLPLLAPLPIFGLPARYPFGEQNSLQRLLEDPLRIAGTRPYQWGDEPRRINWKATARTGMLQSKLYEPGDQRRILLLLDSRTFLQSWLGTDPELQEFTISLAASMAHQWLTDGYLVGLATNGILPSTSLAEEQQTPAFFAPIRVPMARGERQEATILSTLGQLQTYFSKSMDQIIEAEQGALSFGTTVVLVSTFTTLQTETVQSLLQLRRRGTAVHLVLTGDKETELTVETADLPVQRPGGREVWHELLQSASNEAAEQHVTSIDLG